MKVAVVHYHLRRGGVTRVIETALAGFRAAGVPVEIAVLAGEAPMPDSPIAPCFRPVEGLGYRAAAGLSDAEALAAHLQRQAEEFLGGPPDLWHFHNHSLGKNVALPAVLERLIDEGARLLLQIHDFAEDGRPANYARQAEFPVAAPRYPDASQVHYAVLNQRDAAVLRRAGLADPRLHLLPNAVTPPAGAGHGDGRFTTGGRRLLLYPTRGIRRKNMGELLLLGVLCGDRYEFASTLAPENPEWQAIHDRWIALASGHRLPVRLGLGGEPGVEFGDLIAAADSLITTSVAEGFGLAFLEPWLAGKSVRGRNLPAITADFAERGIDLDGLYERIEIPVDWVGENVFRGKLERALSAGYRSYGRELPADAADRAFAAAVIDGKVDFGRLDEELQEIAIATAVKKPDAIDPPDLSRAPAARVAANSFAVEEGYGVARYGARLEKVYLRILAEPISEPGALDAGAVLDAFLDPDRFFLLRT